MYLNFEEFQALTKSELDKTSFEKYYPKAEAVLDNATSHFYQAHDLDTDVPFRANQFKKALCAQIIFFDEMKTDTSEGINSTPQSFSAGRTSVSSRYNTSLGAEKKSLLVEDAYIYLEGTGLLYRGVR
ncbi:hypothetical protein M2149_000783 [Lachnospiraceae bacterium PFB1-21]